MEVSGRQDAIFLHALDNETREEIQLDYCVQYNWSQDDINFFPAIQLNLECDQMTTQRIMYALICLHMIGPHRTATGKGCKKALDGSKLKAIIITDEKLLAAGVPTELETLGPGGMYYMQLEIVNWLECEVSENPSILCDRQAYDEKSAFCSNKFKWWGHYHDWEQSQGGGMTAGGKRTTTSFWEANRDAVFKHAQQYVNDELFDHITKLFCAKYVKHVKASDLGWFAKMKLAAECDTAEPQKMSREEAVAKREVGALMQLEPYLAPASPCEALFGLLGEKIDKNVGMRQDGHSAQAAAQCNRTFEPDERLDRMNKIAQLAVRDTAVSNRKAKTETQRKTETAQVQRKLELKGAKRDLNLAKTRATFSQGIEQFGVKVPTLEEFKKQMKKLKQANSRREVMEAVYGAIVFGWDNPEYACKFGGKEVCKLCDVAGGDKPWALGGHMENHCVKLLTKVKKGDTKKPDAAPEDAEMTIRGFGDFSMGKRTGAANEARTAKRQKIHDEYVQKAKDDPQEYAATIRIEDFTQELVGRKIEIRLKLKQTELWCFEGIIVELKEESEEKEQKLSLKSKHAVVRVHWDECFDMHDSDHALAPRKCMQEKAHGGWNLLTAAFVQYQQELQQQAEQEQEHEARSSMPGREYLDAQAEAA